MRQHAAPWLLLKRMKPPSKAEPSQLARILVVDDDQEMCDALRLTLQRQGNAVTAVTAASAALERVGAEDFDVVLTDLQMPGMDGLSLCEHVLGVRPDMPVIVVTGRGSLESAIAAIRTGAFDFITKPVNAEILNHAVGRALQHRHLRDEVKRLHRVVAAGERSPLLVGESVAMRRLYALIGRVAEGDASVLIYGETGTGKELIARAIHAQSRRKAGPFVAVNCAAIPHTLLESELFGHVRGAFTDAKGPRTGLFSQANGGTLLLDEIGELPLPMQPKLLRALQERTVRPVGGDTEVPFDARIVTATNRDLEHEVVKKRFREDLYYRLNVVKIDLPPLRDRGGDILRLAQHFLGKFAKVDRKPELTLSESSAAKLMAYNWPGNVRELENCIERAVALARFDQLTVDDLPERIRAYRADRVVVSANDATEVITLSEMERRYILQVLSLVGGNKSQAARALGLDRRTLHRRLDQYDAPDSTAGASERPAPES